MVVGFSSNFTEGYQNFTADDTLMLENVKQAITYAKQNKFIPNIDNNIKVQEKSKQMLQDMDMMNKYMDKNLSNNNPLPSGSNINQSSDIEYPMTMPNQMSKPPMPSSNNMPPMPPSNNMQQMPPSNNMQQIPPSNNMPPMSPSNNMPPSNSSFKNISKDKKDIDDNEEDDDEDDDEEEDDDDDDSKTDIKKLLHTQSNTRRQHMNNTNKDDKDGDIEESFQGSVILEKQCLKKILLALLISFIAYLVVHMCINNVIPINDISPQLKKFKNLIYGFLFFIITYLCLEMF